MSHRVRMDKQDRVERGLGIFERPVPFAQAFPAVAEMRITVAIRLGGPLDQKPQKRHFSVQNPPGEYVRCPRASCTDGGWCIGDVLREMVSKRETLHKTGGVCSGRQRMNRKEFRDCLADFEVEIHVTYKAEN